ncbi:MAG: DNA cytosine methyltransferase [Syntrophales bacterium]
MTIRVIDMFCGAGGSSWGARVAGAEIVAGFDKWEVAGRVYQDNFPEACLYTDDLRNVNPAELKKQLGEINLIIASPECTNHSPAKGGAPRCEKSRGTAFYIVRFAEAFKPRWIVIENVVSMKKWERYEELLGILRKLGYHCRQQHLNASDFSVPQSRRRLFVLCDRESMPSEVKQLDGLKKTVTSIINANGIYPFTPLRIERRATATLDSANRAIAELGDNESFLIVYYGSDHAGGWQPLDRPLRTITTLDRFAYVKPTPNGHVMRMLQPEELKLAMGWPKKFKIDHGTRREKIKMIGNAVCPKVMKSVIKTLCFVSRG